LVVCRERNARLLCVRLRAPLSGVSHQWRREYVQIVRSGVSAERGLSMHSCTCTLLRPHLCMFACSHVCMYVCALVLHMRRTDPRPSFYVYTNCEPFTPTPVFRCCMFRLHTHDTQSSLMRSCHTNSSRRNWECVIYMVQSSF
jgi:hypothetical protein